MKISSTMYTRLNMGVMAADSELTKQLCHMTPLFTQKLYMSQTSFSHISINSLMILMVSMAMESP